ncbi:MAG: hypothetical protein IOC82_17085 [Aestuariivirga sp.]|uniref:hypothetical protein n=1 Tax=Aestuariivirga sp. TaxID=2650926 RepID=UPI0025BF4134|nr:hypothetical protein [Aestuariivirga sp.]MCA3562722.1 hypothetical protein [Aestuariivirga sp.]
MTLAFWPRLAARHNGPRALGLLLLIAIVLCPLLPFYNVVDFDVAFLAWTAEKWLHGAVYGRDILEINPPLCMFLYLPAALLAPITGLEWGVRLSMLGLTLLSIAALWRSAGAGLRLPLAAMLLAFVSLAFPNFFAQREQIVLLLTAPYVAGAMPGRRWGLLSGLMAAVGFLMKPHFLIPLALIVALRRSIGREEKVILAAGIAYGVILLAFFRPYLTEMIPMGIAPYRAVGLPVEQLILQAAVVLLSALPLAAAAPAEPAARPYLLAALGFTAAAVLQGKGFYYHFLPAFGFLSLYLTVLTFNPRPLVAGAAAAFLAANALLIGSMAAYWFALAEELAPTEVTLLAELNRSDSFISFVPQPYPAFPTAIHTRARYVGLATSGVAFSSAVARYETGLSTSVPTEAERLTLWQALRELAQQPEIVITLDTPVAVEGRPFDILDWLMKDEAFRAAWSHYQADRVIGPFRLYRRVEAVP